MLFESSRSKTFGLSSRIRGEILGQISLLSATGREQIGGKAKGGRNKDGNVDEANPCLGEGGGGQDGVSRQRCSLFVMEEEEYFLGRVVYHFTLNLRYGHEDGYRRGSVLGR